MSRTGFSVCVCVLMADNESMEVEGLEGRAVKVPGFGLHTSRRNRDSKRARAGSGGV